MSDFNKKTVLVTGATGLMGSNIVDRLMEMGDVKVVALARNKKKSEKKFKDYIGNKNFITIIQDICTSINLPKDVKVDYIFHAAGAMAGEVINNKPLEVIDANLTGTRNCLDLLHKQKKAAHDGRLVLFSSVTVYGNNSNSDRIVTEKDTDIAGTLEVPYAAYAETKRMSEVLALSYCRQHDIDVVIARLSTVYGYTRFPPNTAFYEFIKKALSNEEIALKSSGLPRRDNIYIDDAIDGLLLICENGIKGEAYNISSNGDLENFAAIDEIAEIVAKVSSEKYGKNIDVRYADPSRKNRVAGVKLDNTKVKALGFKLRFDLKKGIEETIYKYKK